jgi:hypothetical protein
MKIAYCIVCHKFTPVLEELVRQVGGANDVYIHVDAKVPLDAFAPLRGAANFLENRVPVAWGRYSQIEATLRLLDATRAHECDYIALISGDTLPLKNDDDIKHFLWDNRGQEFIFEAPLQPRHAARVRYKYPDRDPRGSMWAALRRRLRLLPRNKYFHSLPPLHFATNWFAITPALRDYFFDYLGTHPEYTEAFRHSHCGDELFFTTLAANSPFKEKMDRRRYMYADWKTGPQFPRTLDESDFPRLRAATELWARKFADNINLEAYRDLL